MKFSVNEVKNALGELQTVLHWYMAMTVPPSAVGAFPQNLVIRCNSATLPESEESNNKVELQGHGINFVGKTMRSGSITLSFVEGTDAAVTNYFTRWRNAKWSADGTDTQGAQELTAALKADIVLYLQGPDDVTTQTYTLIGCIPIFSIGGSLSQTPEPLIPSITLEYDDWHLSTEEISW